MEENRSSPTRKQLDFIKKLREASEEREEKLQSYLSSKGKSDISELSVPETSELIDAMKSIKVEGEQSGGGIATGKQINFLSSLQDTEERIEMVSQYLKDHGKDSVNVLSIPEASDLIDRLMQTPKGERLDPTQLKATPKQVKFIKSLQKNEDSVAAASKYMKDHGKLSEDDLSRKEASELIEKLKSMGS
ncbi:hypothetical protein IX51_01155 [uncultured archaeon]|nr:hypothetical protein IX51_01155 [uncultured archaeon]